MIAKLIKTEFKKEVWIWSLIRHHSAGCLVVCHIWLLSSSPSACFGHLQFHQELNQHLSLFGVLRTLFVLMMEK